MDDFLPISPLPENIQELLTILGKKYKISNLGYPTTYLKWNINRTQNGHIHVS